MKLKLNITRLMSRNSHMSTEGSKFKMKTKTIYTVVENFLPAFISDFLVLLQLNTAH